MKNKFSRPSISSFVIIILIVLIVVIITITSIYLLIKSGLISLGEGLSLSEVIIESIGLVGLVIAAYEYINSRMRPELDCIVLGRSVNNDDIKNPIIHQIAVTKGKVDQELIKCAVLDYGFDLYIINTGSVSAKYLKVIVEIHEVDGGGNYRDDKNILTLRENRLIRDIKGELPGFWVTGNKDNRIGARHIFQGGDHFIVYPSYEQSLDSSPFVSFRLLVPVDYTVSIGSLELVCRYQADGVKQISSIFQIVIPKLEEIAKITEKSPEFRKLLI